MNIVIIGASGRVGRHALEQALAAGHTVTAAVRYRGAIEVRHPALSVVSCDVRNADEVCQAVAGHEAVIVALGDPSRGPTDLYSTGARNTIAAMQEHGVRRLVFLSNFGVLGERAGDLVGALLLMLVRRVIAYTLADHRLALDAMRDWGGEWVAVRPMALDGGPRTGRYRVAIEGLPDRGRRVSRADVAEFMLEQATATEYLRSVPAIAY